MSGSKLYPVPETAKRDALIDRATYDAWYRESINSPDTFWSARANELLDWMTPWHTVHSGDFGKGEARWFDGATLNVSVNCIDRHLPQRADQTAIIWEGDEPDQSKNISYRELHEQVCKLANVLRARGVKKGDRVCIYMPMIPEAAYAMLACARIGAIHSVVFGGFSPEALKDRLQDAEAGVLITADEGVRGGKAVPLKVNADKALADCPAVHTCLVVQRTAAKIGWQDGRDIWYHEALMQADGNCAAEPMAAEDPLFILYTSGSTGKPKGVLHTTAGYLLGATLTHKYVFDYHDGDIYWCTADV
ncbi:AMP-binding protein, partial [Alcanivorax sp. 1008]|uniref:AMP-binding protein n=1 Tax=Alcanivorax sp. 1008 TaxID=2816853 RepID=UPI001D5382CF